jgi:hypothetical protein
MAMLLRKKETGYPKIEKRDSAFFPASSSILRRLEYTKTDSLIIPGLD